MNESLFAVEKGKKKQPINMVLVGQAGIGKSSFAAAAPSPVFLGCDETGELDVARMPRPKTFAELLAQLDHLIKNKGLEFRTIVIDTLDSVEELVHKELLDSDPKKTGSMIAAHGGYGKALDMAASRLGDLRERLKALRDQCGMNVIIIAHAKKAQAVDSILGMAFDTQEMALHAKAQAIFANWVSAILFATYVIHPQAGTGTDKIFAMGEGQRMLLTDKRPGHIGKNRFSLPYEMPLDYATLAKAVDKFYVSGPNATDITATIEGLCTNVDEELKGKVLGQVKTAKGDVAKLQKVELRLREILQNGVSANA